MSRDVRYYKGKYRVAVLSESPDNWVVEALEPFEDEVYGKKVKVNTGEKELLLQTCFSRGKVSLRL